MRKKDMQAAIDAGTIVAVGRGLERGEIPDRCRQARIVSLSQPRRVHTGARSDFGGHLSGDGVRIAYLDDAQNGIPDHQPITGYTGYIGGDKYENTTDRVVGPRDIYDAYDQWVTDIAEVRARKAEENDAKLARQRRSQEAADAIGEFADGLDVTVNRHGEIVLSPEAAVRIAKRLQETTCNA
jgi:hypothetical protein